MVIVLMLVELTYPLAHTADKLNTYFLVMLTFFAFFLIAELIVFEIFLNISA